MTIEVIVTNNLTGPLVLDRSTARLIALMIVEAIIQEMSAKEGGDSREVGATQLPESAVSLHN